MDVTVLDVLVTANTLILAPVYFILKGIRNDLNDIYKTQTNHGNKISFMEGLREHNKQG